MKTESHSGWAKWTLGAVVLTALLTLAATINDIW